MSVDTQIVIATLNSSIRDLTKEIRRHNDLIEQTLKLMKEGHCNHDL